MNQTKRSLTCKMHVCVSAEQRRDFYVSNLDGVWTICEDYLEDMYVSKLNIQLTC